MFCQLFMLVFLNLNILETVICNKHTWNNDLQQIHVCDFRTCLTLIADVIIRQAHTEYAAKLSLSLPEIP